MTSYLIAHRVRGQPAFDIAERCEFEDGSEYWIVSTSGHRAYPYWSIEVDDLIGDVDQMPYGGASFMHISAMVPDMPPSLQDHYPANKSPADPLAGLTLLQKLGLVKPASAIKRRF